MGLTRFLYIYVHSIQNILSFGFLNILVTVNKVLNCRAAASTDSVHTVSARLCNWSHFK